VLAFFAAVPDAIGDFTHWTGGSVAVRLAMVIVLTSASVLGTWALLPPSDYLPQGNRNLVFGLLIPPPSYNLDQQGRLADRIEETMRPFWEAGKLERGSPEYAEARSQLPAVPTFDFAAGGPGAPVVPPPLENYFIVSLEGAMFHGGISTEPEQVVDYLQLFRHATRPEAAPDVLAFAFQVPLFQLGGRTGSAVKIDLAGDDLDEVARAALAVYMKMIQRYGVFSVQPDPSNFNVPGPEMRVVPDPLRLAEVGLTTADLGLAVQTLGDGAILGDYRIGGRTIDLKLMSRASVSQRSTASLAEAPIATSGGSVVPLGSLGTLRRVNAAPQINRENRQRAVTLQFTAPRGLALEQAIGEVEQILVEERRTGVIPPTVSTSFSGSASKLASVRGAMLGDGTFLGLVGSAMFLALFVVYLLMCVLFQSFLRPLIILFSVPLATLGGFAALYGVFVWSSNDPYMPVQSLDVLTMLGFVILIGVVVNNAILIVHQTQNFMRGAAETGSERLAPRRAITEAVRTRVRPIFMSTLTSVLGMAPLVLMPGSGSELYRGLGSVVVGGLLVSTIFTLFLVPALLGLTLDLQEKLGLLRETRPETGDASGARTVTAFGALALAALVLPVLGACTASGPATSPAAHEVVRAVLADELDRLGPEPGAALELAFPPTGIGEALGDREEDLEARGGPASYRSLQLEPPESLTSRPETIRKVDLNWAVTSASEHNLGVRLGRATASAAGEGITIAEAEFDPVLFARTRLGTIDDPRSVPVLNGIPLGSSESASDRISAELGLRQKLASGATLEASTSLEWFDDRTRGIRFDPDPSYRSGLGLSVEQPLLRGFGSEVALADIALRRNEHLRSEHALRRDLLTVLDGAERAYWDLHEAWMRLAIQTRLTAEGEEVERVLRERRTFDAQPAEYSDALATLERRRADLIAVRRTVARASDRLKAIVNDPEARNASDVLLAPDGELAAEPLRSGLRQAVAAALSERPEIRAAVLAIEDADLRARVAANLEKPALDLRAGAFVAGLDDDVGSSYRSFAEDDYHELFVALSFELPVGNRAAEARSRQSLEQASAATLAYESAVQDVLLQVKEALRDVRTFFAMVGATRAFRLAQTENLRALLAEEEQRGRLTPEFLNLKFQRQERLAESQVREVAALADYNRAIAAFHHAIGSGLRADRLHVVRLGGSE
jgi:outer membrane protein TolC